MPENPPAIHTPPSAAPTVPGGVHAVPSASPATPGAVHVVPEPGGAGALTVSGVISPDVTGSLVAAGTLNSKGVWSNNGEPIPSVDFPYTRVAFINWFGWRWVLQHYEGALSFEQWESAVAEISSPELATGWVPSGSNTGTPSFSLAPGTSLPTPPAIVTGAPAATPATPGGIHAAPSPAPAAPPAITP
jgi:hypothetical protein